MSRRPFSNRFLALAAVLVAAAVVAWLALGRWQRSGAPLADPATVRPTGSWHVSPTPALPADGDPEELARLLSLPYSAGGAEAGARSGITHFDRERAWPGLNLYTSGDGPEVRLVDMEGRLLHRWRLAFEEAFPGKPATADTAFIRRARLLPGGDLLAIYQGGGLVKLDRDSRLLWKVDAGFYNDLFVLPDGRIVGLTKRAEKRPELREDDPVLEDRLVWLDRGGERLASVSLLDALGASPFAPLLRPLPASADILHSNTSVVLDGAFADRSPIFGAGNVLVSLREIDVVAIVEPDSGLVVWAQRGPWKAQHHPTLVEGPRILLFDNKGAGGRSRVLELDPLTGEIPWEYRGPPQRQLWSAEAGSAQRLPNGNTLISESGQGRALEITREGEIVWEFVSPHRAGPRGELVATLFEVLRLPDDRSWLPATNDRAGGEPEPLTGAREARD